MNKLKIGQILEIRSSNSNWKDCTKLELIADTTASNCGTYRFKCVKENSEAYYMNYSYLYIMSDPCFRLIKDTGKYCAECNDYYLNGENNLYWTSKFICWKCEINIKYCLTNHYKF